MAEQKTRRVELGRALRNLRQSLGLTVYQAARLMGNKSSDGTSIARWERGEVVPLANRLWAYLDALGLTFADLDRELNPAPIIDPRLEEIAERIRRIP